MNKSNNTSWMSSSLLLPGCKFTGMGIGMLFNATQVGLFIGMGAGFITIGIIKLMTSKEKIDQEKLK